MTSDELNEALDRIQTVVESTTEALTNIMETIKPIVEDIGRLCGEYAVVLSEKNPDYVNNRRSVNPKTRGKKW